MMESIIKASLETRHYTFEAYGADREQAATALAATIAKHCAQRGVPGRDFWNSYGDSVVIDQYVLGCGYRDGMMLTRREK